MSNYKSILDRQRDLQHLKQELLNFYLYNDRGWSKLQSYMATIEKQQRRWL